VLLEDKKLKMTDSIKFAQRILPEVLKKMGVDPKERGYSARTIQREISAILEEC
jgi:hypothetical protein